MTAAITTTEAPATVAAGCNQKYAAAEPSDASNAAMTTPHGTSDRVREGRRPQAALAPVSASPMPTSGP